MENDDFLLLTTQKPEGLIYDFNKKEVFVDDKNEVFVANKNGAYVYSRS
jgi:hypothetical protein